VEVWSSRQSRIEDGKVGKRASIVERDGGARNDRMGSLKVGEGFRVPSRQFEQREKDCGLAVGKRAEPVGRRAEGNSRLCGEHVSS